MNLKDFLANRDKPPELYWSLVLESGWVQAGVWYIGAKSAEIISTSPPTPWEVESELIGATDAALSSAIQKLPEEYKEPSKTVFGVPSAWVKEGEIVPEKLSVIKTLCTELSLSPVGFVVLPEAIAHLCKSEEGTPVNAIIIGLGKNDLEISVFKLGSLAGSTTVSRSVSLIDDVTEGLSRFEGASPLPSRFILFNGKGAELDEAKETLTAEPWEDSKIKFLHTPKVEILVSERKVFATSLAGANEIADVSQINSKVEELDVQSPPVVEAHNNVATPTEEINPSELGFSVGEDVSLKQTIQPSPQPEEVEIKAPLPHQEMQHPKPLIKIPTVGIDMGNYMQKTKQIFTGFSNKFHLPHQDHNMPRKKTPTFVGIFLLLLFIIGMACWWFLPKADITIYVTPKNFQENLTVALSKSGASDPEQGILPAQILEETITGEKTVGVTGSKTVGDRAKGEVQIQNGTAFPINLSVGSILTSSGNLKFTMDKAASISAALSPTSPGVAVVPVTADAIGAEFNLAKGEVFKVGNYPKAEVDGTSTGDFGGGSSRLISAVSAEDLNTIESQLMEELKGSALDKLEDKATENQYFVNNLVSLDIASQDFNHKLGDEADNLKLELALDAKGVAVDKTKLLEYTKAILGPKVPQGFVLRDSQITFEFTFEKEEDDKLVYKLATKANFLPQTDLESIKKQIAGKTPNAAETYLALVPGFTRAGVTLKPKLPGPLGLIPWVKKNITVEIVAER